MNQKNILVGLALILLFPVSSTFAQAYWLKEPLLTNRQLDDSVTILVDLKLTENKGMLDTFSLPMYIWFWCPFEFAAGTNKANGIGQFPWKNSNELYRMKHEGNKVYSYTFIPTQLFEMSYGDLRKSGQFCFLVKPKDGGGFGEQDYQSQDCTINFNTNYYFNIEKDTVVFDKNNSVVTMRYHSFDSTLTSDNPFGPPSAWCDYDYNQDSLTLLIWVRPFFINPTPNGFLYFMGKRDQQLKDSVFVLYDKENVGIGDAIESVSSFSIFPNPVSEELHIRVENNHNNSRVLMMNSLGKEVLSVPLSGVETIIDMRQLAEGFYFINILLDDKLGEARPFSIVR